jgi:xanthine dehydrogenase accessory factor
MEELFADIEKLAIVEKRVAMATLVATRGTSPKKEGAKMWVGEEGRILGSVTIGGCVDAKVIAESEQALASFEPRLLQVNLADEDAWEIGFSCAGNLDVLIEPVDLTSPNCKLLKMYRAVSESIDKGKCAVIATSLKESSNKLLVLEDGQTTGTLGDPDLDSEARAIALEQIPKRTSGTISLRSATAPTDVFFEVHGPPPTLIVFGAGHVSIPLIKLAHDLGLKTVVVDGRPRFATKERFPDVDKLLIGIPSEIARTLDYTSSTFVVLTAHDYKYDLPVLKIVLPARPAYVGLLGSKRRGNSIKEFLKESGLDQSLLAQLHVPTGLDIGSETAAEIALSILAEAVAVKAGRRGESLKVQNRER